ncbi:MAG TPA: DUF6519 domain-containing protein [Kofleriaceae bacterium]|jgi:hypothetical protein
MGVISKDTFDPMKQYVSVRLQQGVPIVDADWNESDDIRSFELRAFIKWCIGDGIPSGNNAFAIAGAVDDFTIQWGGGGSATDGLVAGRAFVDGRDVVIGVNQLYSKQRLHVSQDPGAVLATKWGVPPIPALAPSAQPITIFLDVWDRLVTPTEDPSLVLAGLQVESCARTKREWCVRTYTGAAPPAVQVGHSTLPLAIVKYAAAGQPVTLVTDLRRRGISLQSFFDGTAALYIKQLQLQGPLYISTTGNFWDLTNTEGDLKIGNDTTRLKMGVATGGGGAGDSRIRAQGGSNRLILGGGTSDQLFVNATGVGVQWGAPVVPLSFGNAHAPTKLAIWEDGDATKACGFGNDIGQLRIHTSDNTGRITFLDAPSGNETLNAQMGAANTTYDIGFPNKIRFSSVHTGISNNTTQWSEISSDTGTYKSLMFVGNKSAGLKDKTKVNTLRRITMYDRLEVSSGAQFNGVYAGMVPTWLTDQNAEPWKYEYESLGMTDPGHNLRLVTNQQIFMHAPTNVTICGLETTQASALVVRGTIAATGSVSGTVKNFRIPHPLAPDTRDLVHSCIEGPEAGVYYRGEARLVDGIARIELPAYFEALTRKDGRSVQLTAIWDGPDTPVSQLAAARVVEGRFTVHSVDRKNASQAFYWEVKAVRADIAPLEIEPKKGEAIR